MSHLAVPQDDAAAASDDEKIRQLVPDEALNTFVENVDIVQILADLWTHQVNKLWCVPVAMVSS